MKFNFKLFSLVLILSVFQLPLIFNKLSADISGFEFDRFDIPDEEYHNELLETKELIESQFNSTDEKKARKAFKKESKNFNKLIKKSKLNEASFKLYEIETIYSGIGEFIDDILFQNIQLSYALNDYSGIKNYSLSLLENFYNSEFKEETVHYLGEAYFRLREDDKLISLYQQNDGAINELAKFQLANAYFNNSDYIGAAKYIDLKTKNKELLLKVHCLDGLIIYELEGASKALDKFKWIELKYREKYDDYYFVYLTLARLYYQQEEMNLSASYYDKYYALEKKEINVDILYEIGLFYRQFDKDEIAKIYFESLVNQYPNSSLYSSAQANIAEIEQISGSFSLAKSRIEEEISVNDLLLDTTLTKEKLFARYQELLVESSQVFEKEDSLTTDFKQKLDNTQEVVTKSSRVLNSLYAGSNGKTILGVRNLEEEYFYNSDTYFQILKYQHQDNTKYYTIMESHLDNQIALIDSNLVSLQFIRYLSAKDEITFDDYELAQLLAAERYSETRLEKTWSDIKEKAVSDNNVSIVERADKAIDNLNLNIQSLDKIAEIKFGLLEKQELENYINNEEIGLEKDREEFILLKGSYKKNLNKKIKIKLDKQEKEILASLESISERYYISLAEIKKDVAEQRKLYQLNLLNILFNESKSLDSEYNDLQKEIFGNIENE